MERHRSKGSAAAFAAAVLVALMSGCRNGPRQFQLAVFLNQQGLDTR